MHTRAFDAAHSLLLVVFLHAVMICLVVLTLQKSLYLKNHHVDTKASVVGLLLIPSLCNQ